MAQPKYKICKIVSLKMIKEKSLKYDIVTNPNDVISITKPLFEDSAVEKVVLVGLDTHNNPTVIYILTGSVNQCSVSIPTLMKVLLLANSTSAVLLHNHPADSLTPSQADWEITRRMKEACKLLEIYLQDHIIVNSDVSAHISLRTLSQWR